MRSRLIGWIPILLWLLIPLALLVLLPGCASVCKVAPQLCAPTPAPTPTPEPPPEPPPPDPEPVCVPPDLVTECWHKPPGGDWEYIPAPEPPDPEPPDPEPPSGDGVCVRPECPVGDAQAAGPTLHGVGPVADTWDATPRVCGFYPDGRTCTPPGIDPERRCVPLAPEGAANSDWRLACETALMGGPEPVWEIRGATGTITLEEAGWPARVKGSGTYQIRWCFPSGKACSVWKSGSR